MLLLLTEKYQTEAELSDNDFSALSLGLLSSQLTKVHTEQTWVKKTKTNGGKLCREVNALCVTFDFDFFEQNHDENIGHQFWPISLTIQTEVHRRCERVIPIQEDMIAGSVTEM